MKHLLLALGAGALLAAPGRADLAACRLPSSLPRRARRPAQLEKCGVPRNAADDYRPAPLLPDQTRAHRVTTDQKFHVETVAKGLVNPWALAFLPSGNYLVTIRKEGLRTVTPDGKISDPIAGTPIIKNAVPLFGMHDVFSIATLLELHDLSRLRHYLAIGRHTGYIASAKLSADEKSLTDFTILKEGPIPRRIIQDKDGSLFVITADIITPYVLAQSLESGAGKVLHINTNGTPRGDNPFAPNPKADPSIYALGVRDPQSMAFHPVTGDLWIVENEPRGGDELNIIKPGKNYGFPLISYGRDNDGKLLNGGLTQKAGLEQPVYFWTPSVAFSGMTFYTGDKLPKWRNSIFAGGLSGMQLSVSNSPDGRVVAEEKPFATCAPHPGRPPGPDGNVYVITDADGGF
jgi:glucose/arabinose dehydrogenase